MAENEEESVPSRAMSLRAHPSPTTPLTAVSSDFDGHRRRVSFGSEFRHRYPSNASLNAQGNLVVRPKGFRRCIQKLTVKNILLFLLFFALALIIVYFGAFYLLKFDLLHFVGFAQNVPQSQQDRIATTKYAKQSTTSTTPVPIKFQLIEAVKARDLAQTNRLLENGVDVNSVDEDGWTPLHFASQDGHMDMVKLLLGVRNINPNIQTKKMLFDKNTDEHYGRYAPLHLASAQGHCQVLLALLNASAHVNVQDGKKWTALHFASNLGHLECVLNLLKRPGIDVRIGSNHLITALHLAAKGGYYTLLQPLLDHGAKIDAIDGVLAATPLHYAVKNGHKSAVGILLNRNASVTLKSKYTREANHSDISVLHWATIGPDDKFEIVEALLKKGANTEAVAESKLTPLHWATYKWLLKSAELLLKWNASVNARSETYRNTPLHNAASKGSPEMVMLLLAYKADIEATDHLANTPLIIAAKWGHVNVANILLQNGANVSALSLTKESANEAKHNLNSLHWAALQNDNAEMIELLLGWNASIDSKDRFEQTALHLASRQGHAKVVEKLLEKGANTSAVYKFSDEPEISRPKVTPLHGAVMNGHLVVVKLLVLYGADIEAEISLERTPLVLAIKYEHLNIVKFLLEKQASVFALSRMRINEAVASCTPLQHAAILNGSNAAEIAELLLQSGADLETEDLWKWRPIHNAISKPSSKVLEVFLKFNANITARARRTNGNHEQELSPILTAAIYSKEPYYKYAYMLRLLLKRNGQLVRDKDSVGRTPLHHSVLNNCVPCVVTLLDYNAPKNLRDNDGKTPMDLARGKGNRIVVNLLAKED